MNITYYVLRFPPHYDLRFSKFTLPHPSQSGFVERIGEPKGQLADYGVTVENGHGIHVLEFQDHYLVHWDEVDPTTNPIDHIIKDAPQYVPLMIIGFGVGLVALATLIGE